jgi:hypothetical protein
MPDPTTIARSVEQASSDGPRAAAPGERVASARAGAEARRGH